MFDIVFYGVLLLAGLAVLLVLGLRLLMLMADDRVWPVVWGVGGVLAVCLLAALTS